MCFVRRTAHSVRNTYGILELHSLHHSERLSGQRVVLPSLAMRFSVPFMPTTSTLLLNIIICSSKRRSQAPVWAVFRARLLFISEYAFGDLFEYSIMPAPVSFGWSDCESAGPRLLRTLFKAVANWPMSAGRSRRSCRLGQLAADRLSATAVRWPVGSRVPD